MAYRGAQRQRNPVSRGKRRRKGVASVVGRWALMGIVGLVVGKIALSFGGQVIMLALAAREQQQEIAALRAETERLSQQNTALREEMRRLNTPSGIILEARKQGYGFPGERLLVVEPASGHAKTAQ